MSAVWRVARAAIRRRRLQTIVIALVVMVSAGTIVLALGLLTSASAPFDRALAQQSGAHVVVAFDRTLVTDAQLTKAAKRPEVQAVAGPFAQVTLDTSGSNLFVPPLTTVGRADPGGPVDRLDVWEGRWASAAGEIVLNAPPGSGFVPLGRTIELPGRPTLTVVGYAESVTTSADAWVTPQEMTALRPTGTQMLYRFTQADTTAQIDKDDAAVTAGLPVKAVLGTQSYLTVKDQIDSETRVYVPFLSVFGVLGLVVAVLIVANMVSGAVVAGYRNIGVLKALGFSPNQVMAVYLVMVCVPALGGCVLGTVAGNLVARPMLADALGAFGTTDIGIDSLVDVVALVGMPAVVALAALVSALRARRLPAARAISAGSAPRTGRALGVQRWLGGLRLPRSVSLGLGIPFARPARSALTLAAVALGALTVTLAIGTTMSVNAYNDAMRPVHTDRLAVAAATLPSTPDSTAAEVDGPALTDAADEALLRRQPGTTHLAAITERDVQVVGGRSASIDFYRGDVAVLGPAMASGRWPSAGEVALPSRFLNQRGLALGDTITVELDGRQAQLRIAGVSLTNNADTGFADWSTLMALAPGTRAESYEVQLAAGTDPQSYANAAQAADPGLRVLPPRDSTSSVAVALISAATVLTLVLGIVAALGVFNTVALNARERRRDLGMLKSIGMTPRQVTVMMVTSMGGLGVLGGLIGVPLGVAAHQLIVPAMMRAAQSDVFDFVLHVYRAPLLALLVLVGVAIAVLGAIIPARSAARLTIATVLHNE